MTAREQNEYVSGKQRCVVMMGEGSHRVISVVPECNSKREICCAIELQDPDHRFPIYHAWTLLSSCLFVIGKSSDQSTKRPAHLAHDVYEGDFDLCSYMSTS